MVLLLERWHKGTCGPFLQESIAGWRYMGLGCCRFS